MLIILLLVLIFFGPKRIPEIARTIGKGINEIKKVQKDINTEIHRYSDEIENPVKDIEEDIEGFRQDLNSQDNTPKSSGDNETLNTREDQSRQANKGSGQPKDDEKDDDLPYPYNRNKETDDDSPEEKPEDPGKPGT